MLYESLFKGEKSVVLENEAVRAVVLPRIGGKLASFYHKTKSFELLFQNKEDHYRKAEVYSAFELFDAAGFDDAFPSIDAGAVEVKSEEVLYPDHGEIWSSSFDYELKGNKVELWFESRILPYRYTKAFSLQGSSLTVRYGITNFDSFEFPCIWAMHSLINCEEDMELIFPVDTKRVINVLDSLRLGKSGTLLPFPSFTTPQGTIAALDRVLPESSGAMEKFYVDGRVKQGRCGAYYPKKGMLFTVNYDAEILPYLGFWITAGGFRGDYNCALEPANGFYDSIEAAKSNGALMYLKPGQSLEFSIELGLEEEPGCRNKKVKV